MGKIQLMKSCKVIDSGFKNISSSAIEITAKTMRQQRLASTFSSQKDVELNESRHPAFTSSSILCN